MPVFVLHEAGPCYTDNQVLGFDTAEIKTAYQHAVTSKPISATRFCRSNGRTGTCPLIPQRTPRSISPKPAKPFFGDERSFYPFNRTELEKHDPGNVPALNLTRLARAVNRKSDLQHEPEQRC